MAKDRKKGDKIVSESQEKAYWRVYRPPPGFTTVVENSPVPSREQRVKARNRTYEHLAEEVNILEIFQFITITPFYNISRNLAIKLNNNVIFISVKVSSKLLHWIC